MSVTTAVPLTEAKRRIVDRLKRVDDATPAELAVAMGLTEAAVRQHLDGLHGAGLVDARPRPVAGRGRPSTAWALTDIAAELFPDRHGDLTVELIGSVRLALGQEGVDKVIADRTRRQAEAYRAAMPGGRASLRRRAEALAAIRAAEGYVAEVVDAPDGDGLLLVEHHCPICEAASACLDLCRSELEVFRDVLGPDVEVTRTKHLLSGDQRCAYRLQRRPPQPLPTPSR